MKLLKKISVKGVCGNFKADVPETGDLALMRVVGRASAIKKVETPYGPQFGLSGEFRAGSLVGTKDTYSANTCYLPSVAHDQLVEALKANPDATIEFGLDIGVHKASNPIGYEFSVNNLVPIAPSAPMDALMNRIAPALSAPAAASPAAIAAPQPQAKKKK